MSHVATGAGLPAALESLFGPYLRTVVERTARALEKTGFSSLIVHSGSLLPIFADDRSYPFEVNAPFKVWIPAADVSDCFLHFEPGKRPRLLFHQPADFWHKPASLPRTYWSPHFDIVAIADAADARRALPRDLTRAAYIGDITAELAAWGTGGVNPGNLLRHLDFPRAAKTPYELVCLREASRLGALGHLAAAEAFTAGASEFEIELAFLRACGQREQELPYNPIIALNEGGSILHYQVLERQVPAKRHSLLIDAGAEFAGYASDITRTYSLHDTDFAALITGMDDLQRRLCSEVRSGVDWADVHLRAHHLIAALLHDADIIRCNADEGVATGVSSVFLPHGVGHLLGLEVHDVGGFMSSPDGADIPRPAGHPLLRLTRVLEENFVVTMEPGIYFNDQLLQSARGDERGSRINWKRVDAFRPFGGIRIEDNLAITATGCENLTRDAFVTLS